MRAAAGRERPTGGTEESPAIPPSRGGGIRTHDPLTPSGGNAAALPGRPRDPAPFPCEGTEAGAGERESLPRPAAASELSDADLERAIAGAVTQGLGDVARTLAAL